MKIAMIGHKRVPSREGGVEIVVEELSTRFVKSGNEVDLYNRGNKKIKKIRSYKGTKIITIPTINKKGGAVIYSIFASIRALFGTYDILHYHAEGSCAMLWLPHLFKKKIVVTIHGLDWKRAKWKGIGKKYIKFGEKLASKYADEIIVLSKSMQDYFEKEYNRKTIFIQNGVNPPVYRKADIICKKYGLQKDTYILFLARIVPEKGLDYLLEAFSKIKTDKKLVIAGDASDTEKYLNEIQEKVRKDSRVIMTGFVDGNELEELFSNCYLYCLPSDIEGMSNSLLEAMSYGCTCLVSDIEENVQVVQNFGYTFKKGNVADLKEKLEKLIDNNVKEKVQTEYFLKKYDWDEIARKTINLYREVLL